MFKTLGTSIAITVQRKEKLYSFKMALGGLQKGPDCTGNTQNL
ncbi:rCG44401 [Rattus norvegicus]|uniref:RCG44401 n=1 Tax=Rattus norvegicus TaxID=10116 RepID=A6I4K6_RAT|nr:rCG44401 [Rattus norvegicus]